MNGTLHENERFLNVVALKMAKAASPTAVLGHTHARTHKKESNEKKKNTLKETTTTVV